MMIWALADLETSNSSWGRHVNHANSDLTGLYSSVAFYPSLYGANPRVLVTGQRRAQ